MRTRRLAAALAAVLALAAAACTGGDRQPVDIEQEGGEGATPAPAEGQNVPLPDPGDELVEPEEDEPAGFEEEADQ